MSIKDHWGRDRRSNSLADSPERRTSPFLFLTLLLGLLQPANAATAPTVPTAAHPSYLVRSWQTDAGLPQNSVSTITQTRDGYLWLGTFNGLVRFDGERMDVHTGVNTPGLASDAINALHEDRSGCLWIGTDGGGLSRLRNGVFTQVPITNHLGSSAVTALAEDESGALWVGTSEGLFRWEGDRLREYFFPDAPTRPGSICALARDNQDRLWIADRTGFYCRTAGKIERVEANPLPLGVAPASPRGIWSFGGESTVVRWEGGTNTPPFQGLGKPLCLLQTRPGDLWIGGSSGLSRFRAGQRHDYTVADGLSADEILVLFEDREGNLWAGSNGGGLMRLREQTLGTLSVRDGLPGNDVVALWEDSEGRAWIGGFGLGLGWWRDGRWERPPSPLAELTDVYAFAPGREGRLWIGARSGHLLGWQNGRIVSNENLPNEGARVLFEDREGGLWVGSRQDGLTHRLQGRTTHYAPGKSLSHGYVTAIVQDPTGAVWAGTKKGLNRVANGAVTPFYREHGLGSDCIHTLCVDRGGVLWVGTAGGGLARYREGRFATVNAAQGLPNEVVAQILDDGRGGLWLGSNSGICRVDREELLRCADGRQATLQPLLFNRQDGMLNPECAGSFQPSCFAARDGRLWFATVGGVVIIDPGRSASHSLPPPVRIESVTADGALCLPSTTAEDTTEVVVPPGVARVHITYTGLSFAAPEKLQFRFHLAGLDRDWVEAGARRIAYYNRLPPGEYDFRVIARNGDGVWNRSGATITLRVLPFWWQTGWFQVGASLLLALAVAGCAFVVHSRQLRRRLELTEQHHTQLRAAELGEANARLELRTAELEQALANVKTLRGLLPICAACKKIRDDSGYWKQLETYIQDHSEVAFSHGLCPECIPKYFPKAKLPPTQPAPPNSAPR